MVCKEKPWKLECFCKEKHHGNPHHDDGCVPLLGKEMKRMKCSLRLPVHYFSKLSDSNSEEYQVGEDKSVDFVEQIFASIDFSPYLDGTMQVMGFL